MKYFILESFQIIKHSQQ